MWASASVGPRVCCPFVLPHVRQRSGNPARRSACLAPCLVARVFWAPWWMLPVLWPFLSPWDKSPHFVCKSLILLLVNPSQMLGITSSPFWSPLVVSCLVGLFLRVWEPLCPALPQRAPSCGPPGWLLPPPLSECLLTLHVFLPPPPPTTAADISLNPSLSNGPQPSKSITGAAQACFPSFFSFPRWPPIPIQPPSKPSGLCLQIVSQIHHLSLVAPHTRSEPASPWSPSTHPGAPSAESSVPPLHILAGLGSHSASTPCSLELCPLQRCCPLSLVPPVLLFTSWGALEPTCV